jgi:hypothetical protein
VQSKYAAVQNGFAVAGFKSGDFARFLRGTVTAFDCPNEDSRASRATGCDGHPAGVPVNIAAVVL